MLKFIILLLLFGTATSISVSPDVQLKGGLIFKHEGIAQINQDFTQYFRSINSTSLKQLAQKSLESLNLYQVFCDTVADLDKRWSINNTSSNPESYIRYVKTIKKHKLSEAKAVCQGFNARLPEIRNKQEFTDLGNFAFHNNIAKIPSGLHFDTDTDTIRFTTSNIAAYNSDYFNTITYGGSYNGASHKAAWTNYHVKQEARSNPLYYVNPHKDFQIRIADQNDKDTEDYIICEHLVTPQITSDPQHSLYTQTVHATCKRDLPDLVSSTNFAINELDLTV